MLSEPELRQRVEETHDGGIIGCNHAGGHCGVWVKVGDLFRAVEAAVRADQIEKDAVVAANWAPSDWDGWLASETPYWVAAAIRAQLPEIGETDEQRRT